MDQGRRGFLKSVLGLAVAKAFPFPLSLPVYRPKLHVYHTIEGSLFDVDGSQITIGSEPNPSSSIQDFPKRYDLEFVITVAGYNELSPMGRLIISDAHG